MNTRKFKLQDEQYTYPYHYVPHFDSDGHGVRHRMIGRGFEYLCYVAHVVERVEELAPESVLDAGCGDGRVIGSLPSVPRRVGVDLSERAIRFARAFHEAVEFHVADPDDLDERYDVVLAVEVLEHIPDEDVSRFLCSLSRRTRIGGHVIMTVPSTAKPMIDKHYRHYDEELFRSQLASSEANLRIERLEHVYEDSKVTRWYRRLTDNRYWYCEPHWIRKRVWKHVWNRLRITRPGRGNHLAVTLVREE